MSLENAPESRSLPRARFLETAKALTVLSNHRSISWPETMYRASLGLRIDYAAPKERRRFLYIRPPLVRRRGDEDSTNARFDHELPLPYSQCRAVPAGLLLWGMITISILS